MQEKRRGRVRERRENVNTHYYIPIQYLHGLAFATLLLDKRFHVRLVHLVYLKRTQGYPSVEVDTVDVNVDITRLSDSRVSLFRIPQY